MEFQTPSRYRASDFSAMLKTPARQAEPQPPSRPGSAAPWSSTPSAFGAKRRPPGPPKSMPAPALMPSSVRKKPSMTEILERRAKKGVKVGDTPYRDRAAERALGINRDYEDASGGAAAAAAPIWSVGSKAEGEGEEKGAEERQQQIHREIEQSKFLGGDQEHTHLVKGLDTALLTKIRAQLSEEEKAKKEDAAMREAMNQAAARRRNDRLQKKITGEDVGINLVTSIGRAVFHALFRPPACSRFAAGKLAFVFDRRTDQIRTSTIGTTTAGDTGRRLGSVLPSGLLGKLRDAVRSRGERRKAGGRGREKPAALQQQQTEEPAPGRPANEGDSSGSDIFGDVGKYDAEAAARDARRRRRRRRSRSRSPRRRSSRSRSADRRVRFEDVAEDRRREAEEMEQRRKWMRERERERDARGSSSSESPKKKKSARRGVSLLGRSDGYAECFPDTWAGDDAAGISAGMGGVSDDERDDEKDDRKKAEQLTKKQRKREEKLKEAELDREHRKVMRKVEERKRKNGEALHVIDDDDECGGDAPAKRRRAVQMDG